MKQVKISELPITPENYAVDIYERISDMDIGILMVEEERRFINGLIQFYEPENIIEIGVHRGGSTAVILNAASKSSRVVSIDKATEWIQYDKVCKVGEILIENYPKFKKDNWKLITGKDPSEVMDELNMKFDFAVIDSGHFHPCETLNFISILPYMNDCGVVVVHDTTNYMNVGGESQYAPRLLISSVCADKISTVYTSRLFPNIVAFQITSDTRKYVQNVFEILLFPWQYFDKKDTDNVYGYVKKHYTSKQISAFEMAININKYLSFDAVTRVFNKTLVSSILDGLDKDTIFYGAGRECGTIIGVFIDSDIKFDFKIWDRNSNNIKKIFDKPVTLPDFETKAKTGQIMVITIADSETADSVRKQFEALGYIVYHGIKPLISEIALSSTYNNLLGGLKC